MAQESNSQENKDTTTNKVMPNGVVKRSQNPRGNFPWPLGLTLIEAAMVLSIAAVVIAGVMTFYLLTNNNRKMTATTEMLMSIVQEVESVFAQSPTFTGLTTATVMQTNAVPTQYRMGDRIATPLGGSTGIFLEAGPTATFVLQIQNLNQEQCINAAKLNLGNSVQGLYIDSLDADGGNGTGVIAPTSPTNFIQTTGPGTGNVDTSAAVDECNSKPFARVTWVLTH